MEVNCTGHVGLSFLSVAVIKYTDRSHLRVTEVDMTVDMEGMVAGVGD